MVIDLFHKARVKIIQRGCFVKFHSDVLTVIKKLAGQMQYCFARLTNGY